MFLGGFNSQGRLHEEVTFDLSFYVEREKAGHFLARVSQDFETVGMKKKWKKDTKIVFICILINLNHL